MARKLAWFLPASVVAALVAACSKKQPPPPPPPTPTVVSPPKTHAALSRVNDTREGSAIALATLGGKKAVAYIADEDDASVRTVDLESNEVVARTSLDGRPGQMIVDARGRLLVTLRTEQAVVVLEATADPKDALDETARITTSGIEPLAMAITPDDATLVVATAWGHSVEGYRLDTTQRRFVIDVAREPRAVTIANDGKTAFVAHAAASHLSSIAIPATASVEGTTDNIVASNMDVKKIEMTMPGFTEVRHGRRRINKAGNPMLLFKVDGLGDIDDDLDRGFTFRCGTGMLMSEITFPSRVARQSFALAKVSVKVKDKGAEVLEERILAPHMQVATGDASVRSSGYGGGGLEEAEAIPSELFDIDVIDAKKGTKATKHGPVAANVRSGNEACRLPRAAVVDPAHGRLYVACLGVNKVMEYDATSATPTGTFRRAIDVPSGPAAIAIEPATERAIVWSQFDRQLSVFSTTAPPATASKSDARPPAPPQPALTKIAFPPPSTPLAPEAAAGERLFHSAGNTKISRDGRACASCHPDGRDDGLVWSTPDGPRQTIFLAGRVGRETPFGWLGKHGSLKEHITITMKNLKGTGASDEELTQIVAWLRAMKPPPKAKAVTNASAVQRGKELFNSSALQCATCHAEKTDFTDREAHDVASATGADVSKQFLVPSLRFVGGSSPYFHDGRYATLGELLQKNDKMGDTKSLSQADRDALEAYLRTL